MNLVQKFVESEAQKAFGTYRQRFEHWLSTVDVDNNGQTDKQQILDDFDQIREGILGVIGGLTDLQRLSHQYYQKYGHEVTGGEAPKKK
jgi:hypothetical protein